jgi:tetratricopeptide (TPR) repeat protein
LRLQDQVIDAIINNYYGIRPICFSVTVGQGARTYQGRPIDEMLRMIGMVWEVTETQKAYEVDVDRSVDFFMNPNRFAARGINDPTIYQDEATLRLTRNYGNAFLMVADTLRRAGDLDAAAALAKLAIVRIPHAGDPVEFLANILSEQGKTEELKDLIANTYVGDRQHLQLLLARSLRKDEKPDEAETILTGLLKQNPTYQDAYDELMRLYLVDNNMLAIKELMQQWLQYNPDDQKSRAALNDLLNAFEAMDSSNNGTEP